MIRCAVSIPVGLLVCPIIFVCMPCPDGYLYISFPFTSTLVCGDVKVIIHHSSTKPRVPPRFTWYIMVYYTTPVCRY